MLIRLTFQVALVLMLASMLVHLYTFVPGRQIESAGLVIILTASCFLTFIPTIKVMKRVYREGHRFDMWERALDHGPSWVPKALIVLLVYTGFNFFFSLFYLNDGLTPTNLNGLYLMMDHGRRVATLSEVEYFRHKAYEIRGVTTHPILFHAVASGVLYADMTRRKGANAGNSAPRSTLQ